MNIVLAVDGGAQQPSAVALAAALSRATGASLTVAHVYPWSRWNESLGNAYELTIREDAHDILAQASQQLADVPHTVRAIADVSAPRALHALSEELEATLLVIGACHRGPVGRTLLGSVGDRVVHGAPCPVAVAPRDVTRDARLATIAVGYDDSREARAALDWAIGVAELTDARLAIVGVVEPVVLAAPAGGVAYPYAAMIETQRAACAQALAKASERVGDRVEATTRQVYGPAATRLAEEGAGADLLVVGSRAYGPLRSIMLGSTGRALTSESPSPLVLVPRSANRARQEQTGAPTAATA